MIRVLFLNSHPIQYFAPLYQEISRRDGFTLKVFYCSKHGMEGEKDEEFGVEVKWDLPLLAGYMHEFLKNHSPKPSIYGFAGLINLGLIARLWREPKSILVVHGWGYVSNLGAIFFGKMAGHVVCLRGESPASHERIRPASGLRRFFLKKILFRFVDYFLYIGQENRAFYRMYGVPEDRLVFAPYSVDNQRFLKNFETLHPQREQLKKALGLPPGKRIVLFSGKYIDKKRPLDLLHAFARSRQQGSACLVFMGDGALRGEMERFIRTQKLENVVLTGFVNQSKVAEYYAVADIFVMCSQEGETWGLSANEAMNFRLPLLLSNLTGSSADLIVPAENGWVFKTGDVEALAEKLDTLLSLPSEELSRMGEVSQKRVQQYSFQQIVEGLETVHASSLS